MRVLAIEASTRAASIALADSTGSIGEVELKTAPRTAATLHDALQNMIADSGWQFQDLDRIAVTNGPGSFTGLRIAVTTAITMSYVANIQIVPFNTLHAIALRQTAERVAVITDAQRGEFFAAEYAKRSDQYEETCPTNIVSPTWVDDLDQGVVVTGEAISKLPEDHPLASQFADEATWRPLASVLALEVIAQSSTLEPVDCWSLRPEYYRKSAAEEKLIKGRE